jgi:hypothetical protein
MAFRTDITVDWAQSPRLITVLSPSVELTIQDLVDTCRELEDDIINLPYSRLVDAAGKEPLGGGTSVGITATLQNAVVAFEARPGPTWTLCVISGGNLVAVDDVGSPIDPRFPTAFVTIDRTASASATLQDLSALQAASFLGIVSLDINSSNTGTNFPVGTREFPVNNIADCISIAEDRGLREILIVSTMTLDSGDFSAGYQFRADGPVITTLTLDPATDISNCSFANMTLTGAGDGVNSVRECVTENITGFSGDLIACAINGTLTLSGGVQTSMFDCWSNIPGGGVGQYPTVNMGGAGGQTLAVRNYHGGIAISNSSDAANIGSLDIGSGRVIFDSSVTDGSFTVRGNATVSDNSVSPAVIIDNTINAANEAAEYAGQVSIDTVEGISGTEYPIGTPGTPVDNLTDALAISDARGIENLHFHSDYTFQPGDNVSLKTLSGDNASLVQLSFLDGALTAGCTLRSVTVDGFLISPVLSERVIFLNVTGNATGPALGVMQVRDSIFKGTVTLSSALVAQIEVINSVSGAGGTAVIDVNGATVDLSFHNYVGDLQISGFTQAGNELVMSYGGGTVTLDSSNTAGTAWLRGIAEIVDQTAGMTVNDETMTFDSETIRKILQNKAVTDPSTGVMTIYDDDDVTPLLVAQLYEDVAESQIYRGQGAEVRNRLT